MRTTTAEKLAQDIPQEWREDFVKFVRTGEAGEAFLKFLDSDTTAQDIVEAAFALQAEAFEDAALWLRQPAEAGENVLSIPDLANEMAMVVSAVSELSHASAKAVIDGAVATVHDRGVSAEKARSVAVTLERAFTSV